MALRFGPGTAAFLATVAPKPRRELRDALRLLAMDPRHDDLDVKQLRKDGEVRFYRLRVGRYRIVYSPRSKQTYVWRIQHRSEGYDWLDHIDPWKAGP